MLDNDFEYGDSAVRVIPIGGLGEVGMNMMAIETDDDMLVIDCGVQFPEYSTPGIERVIPNMEYIRKNRNRVRAVLITHGHLDHIGGLPHLMRFVNAPIYAPRFAAEMIRRELKKSGGRELANVQVNTVRLERDYRFGEFGVQWISVCHSIPDSCSIYLDTPQGGILHTGDFKFDNEPMLGLPTDYQALSEIGQRGVRLLLSDSTNAEDDGSSRSDRLAAEAIYREIAEAKGRVIIASFSTQIARVQMVIDAAYELGRRVAIIGRSMIESTRLAEEVGHLHIPPEVKVTIGEANSLPDDEVVIMTTGSQGEFEAGISRMARGDHREVRLVEDDTLILSASTIPGNEIAVNEVLNNLARRDVRVITASSRPVHVSGHAKQDELKTMFSILRPEHFSPIHGEFRMLKAHAKIAVDMGVAEDNVNLILDGDVLEIDVDGVSVVDKVPSGYILIQGQGEWDIDSSVMEERKSLASDGVVMVAIAREDGILVGKPRVVTSGFVDASDEARLIRDASQALAQAIEPVLADLVDWNEMDRLVRACLARFFYRRTKRRPLILVTEIELEPGRTD